MTDLEGSTQEFEVSEDLFGAPQVGTVSADEIAGTVTASLRSGNAGMFSLQGRTKFSRFLRNRAPVPSKLNEEYRMYADFDVKWRVDDVDRWSAASAELAWYIAPVLSLSPSEARTAAAVNDSDVFLVATCDLLRSGVASNRYFDLRLGDFNLTPLGKHYFVSPVPFPIEVRFAGNYTCLPGGEVVEVLGEVRTAFPRWGATPASAPQLGA